MLRLALRTVLAGKVRFALTSGVVMLGVAFVVAAFVTADSLRSTFDKLAADINTGSDFTVRGELAFGGITQAVAPSLPATALDDIRAVDGVEAAEGGIFVNGVIPVDGSGQAVAAPGGAPTAGTNWTDDESLSQFYLIDGQWPVGASEFAIDVEAFANHDFALGSQYEVVTPTGPRTFTLTGTAQFGFPENAGIGAVFTLFDTATAQEVLGLPDQFAQIAVRADLGADLEEVRARMEAVLPEGTEVITAAEATEEFSNAFESFIGPLQTTLLVFAFVVLFVSAFIISNAFNIVLGQRVRELSLLRAIGATPRQVRRSVLIEALVVGLAAVLVGLGLGMLGALGIRELFSALGASLPDGPMPLRIRTVAWAVAVGIGFTIVAAAVPALKAARLSPVAGLSDFGSDAGRDRRLGRLLIGGLLAALGAALAAAGLFADFDSVTARLSSLGAGAAVLFVAVSVLSPLVAGAVVSVLARPLQPVFGIAGRLARENAARNPRRTAATAVALTIGLALVAMVSVMGESFKASFRDQLTNAVKADFVVTSDSFSGMPKTVAQDLRAAGAGSVVAFDSDLVSITALDQYDFVLETTVTATDFADLEQVANLDIQSGSLSNIDFSTTVLVHADSLEDFGLGVGDGISMSFVNGETLDLSVAAIYSENAFWGDWLIDQSVYAGVATSAADDAVAIKVADAEPEAVRALLDETLASYPQANLEDRREFQASAESNLDTALALVNALLVFALFVALVGIVNTLTLSVFERTREIGLLRAVGMTRRQLRRMIRWEAATIALYGALVGVGLGLVFGVATAVAIPDEVVSRAAVPILQLVLFVAVATVMGLVAALLPSYRAGRMNVLDAISAD